MFLGKCNGLYILGNYARTSHEHLVMLASANNNSKLFKPTLNQSHDLWLIFSFGCHSLNNNNNNNNTTVDGLTG